MSVISVSHLKKYYHVHQKEAGFLGTIKSLVARKYEKVPAVDDISFSISDGELVGFIGPNGAGKTTTLKCLSGLLNPTGGRIKVLGFIPFKRAPAFLKKIALVMGQKNQLWWDLPPMESFILNKEIYEIDDDQFKKTLDELTDLLAVKNLINVPVRKLSLGERMKCELIAALLHRPQVLFLDEPTIGLDVVMQKAMREFIATYNRRYHATILLTSHYMEDVKQLCKRVIIIDKGKIIFDGQLDKIVKQYTPDKILTVTFDDHVDVRSLAKIGKVRYFNFPQAVISVPRKYTNHRAAQLLQNFPVTDLNIEEVEIDEVIREIFSTKRKQ